MAATSEDPGKIDGLLGVFLLNRGVSHTTSGEPVRQFSFYAMRKDPADGQWAVLTMKEAQDHDNPPTHA